MVVGVAMIGLLLHEGDSLKDKRSLKRRIIERVKSKFNASVAEVGDNDLWRRLSIGVSVVGNDRGFVNSCLDNLINFVEGMDVAEVVQADIEILSI
jgi:hypothetical protein